MGKIERLDATRVPTVHSVFNRRKSFILSSLSSTIITVFDIPDLSTVSPVRSIPAGP
jgi:hypothetical protein